LQILSLLSSQRNERKKKREREREVLLKIVAERNSQHEEFSTL